ncbi:MAG: glycine cleavage system protein GcvH [Bacteroidales bacterium]|nr:glycine cleavage system protein GcvH [Lentimicrobiaceae bacterium]MDD5694087.1 glycine cleavage system protein GcvH [Bacteroidales bacterium]
MKVPDNLKFTEDHEWLRVENGLGYIGVTDFAQSELGDVVFLEVETVGESLGKGETFGTIEAVKTVSDIFMPVSGEILEFNETLTDQPELINKDPYGEGWIVKIRITNLAEVDELLSADDYQQVIGA